MNESTKKSTIDTNTMSPQEAEAYAAAALGGFFRREDAEVQKSVPAVPSNSEAYNDREAKRRAEVDAILARAGVSRSEVTEMKNQDPNGPDGPEILAGLDGEPHPFDELSPREPIIATNIEMIEESMQAASENSTGAAAAVAKRLVPEFGNVLATRTPGALAAEFPPAVQTLITKAQLSPEQTDHLLAKFRDMFEMTGHMRARVETIEIRGPEDIEAIAEAKEVHKALRDERLNAEKRKKIIKEPYLRPSQLIDGVFRIWMDEITPLEVAAKAKAEYVENLERERKAKLAEERLAKLKLFEADGGGLNLGEIDDATFELLYQGAISGYNNRKAEEKRLEEERLERERANEAERERLRQENERLAKERAEADAREAEQRRIAEEARRKQEEAEAELRRQDEERKAEAQRLAAIEEAKRLAPDKDKLLAFIDEIEAIFIPETTEPKAVAVGSTIVLERAAFCDKMRSKIEAGLA